MTEFFSASLRPLNADLGPTSITVLGKREPVLERVSPQEAASVPKTPLPRIGSPRPLRGPEDAPQAPSAEDRLTEAGFTKTRGAWRRTGR